MQTKITKADVCIGILKMLMLNFLMKMRGSSSR